MKDKAFPLTFRKRSAGIDSLQMQDSVVDNSIWGLCMKSALAFLRMTMKPHES